MNETNDEKRLILDRLHHMAVQRKVAKQAANADRSKLPNASSDNAASAETDIRKDRHFLPLENNESEKPTNENSPTDSTKRSKKRISKDFVSNDAAGTLSLPGGKSTESGGGTEFGSGTESAGGTKIGGGTAANPDEKFAVLGVESFVERKRINVVPDWIAKAATVNPNILSGQVPVANIDGLDARILKSLDELGITHFFPVQHEVIPVLLNDFYVRKILRPRDVCIGAPTGSGKTLCYVIPIVQALLSRQDLDPDPAVRALIMLPVQELAAQVFEVFKIFKKFANLKVALCTGAHEQMKISEFDRNSRKFRSLVDVVIATPGRFLDLLHADQLRLNFLEFLVIDEADRMIDEMKFEWLREVEFAIRDDHGVEESLVPPLAKQKRAPTGPFNWNSIHSSDLHLQKILLSATLSQDPERLQRLNLFQPRLFSALREPVPGASSQDVDEDAAKRFTVPDELEQFYSVTKLKLKPLCAYLMINKFDWKRILCFCNSKESARRLKILLQEMGMSSVKECTANVPNLYRKRSVMQFKSGKIRLLICSDLLARGIDFPDVDCVLSYDRPSNLQAYVHRIGRSARAGKTGSAFTLLLEEEALEFQSWLVTVNHWDRLKPVEVPMDTVAELKPKYKTALKTLQQKLQLIENHERIKKR